MTETLQAVKDRLRARYVGKAGVHGIGISRSENAIRVYVDAGAGPDTDTMIEQLATEAEPYPVRVVREDSARIT